MKNYSLSVLFLLVCFFNALSQNTEHFCDNILSKAWTAYEQEKFTAALEYLQDVETCDFENDLLQRRQELQTAIFEAIQQQKNVIEIALKEAELQKKKAVQEQKKAERQEAIAVKEKLKAQKLADSFMEKSQGNFTRSWLRLKQYSAIAPEDSLNRLFILEKANALTSLGNQKEAEKLFNKLVELAPAEDQSRYFLMRAKFYLENDRVDEAISDCIRWVNTGALNKFQSSGIAVDMFKGLRKESEAGWLIERLIEENENPEEKVSLLQNLVDHYESEDQPEKALDAIDRARKLDPQNLELLARKGNLLAHFGRQEDAERIFQDFVGRNGITNRPRDTALISAPGINFRIWENDTLIIVTDNKVIIRFNKFKRGNWEGIYRFGTQSADEFINWNKNLIANITTLSGSLIYLGVGVGGNSANFGSINAYDGAFLSFGLAQWTLGTRENPGELPTLMKRIKEIAPKEFQIYFGSYGLDIDPETNYVYGYLQFAGKKVETRDDKEQFRDPIWGFLFAKAGQDPLIKAIQVEHLLERLKSFYYTYKVHGFTLNEIITSEYGVALLLDNHINLPVLVKAAIEAAMNETGLTDPTHWNHEDEQKVLEAYIRLRATKVGRFGPMFDAIGRAKRTKKYVENGFLSEEKGSFIQFQ